MVTFLVPFYTWVFCLEPRLPVAWRSREHHGCMDLLSSQLSLPLSLLFRDERDSGEVPRGWAVDREVGADRLFRRAQTMLRAGFRLGCLLFYPCQDQLDALGWRFCQGSIPNPLKNLSFQGGLGWVSVGAFMSVVGHSHRLHCCSCVCVCQERWVGGDH